MTTLEALLVQPLPPIVVNLPPASGPPWWATALIALAGAVIGILVTAYIARGREHQKWLWEQRCSIYVETLEYINANHFNRMTVGGLAYGRLEGFEKPDGRVVPGITGALNARSRLFLGSSFSNELQRLSNSNWMLSQLFEEIWSDKEKKQTLRRSVASAIAAGDVAIDRMVKQVQQDVFRPPSLLSIFPSSRRGSPLQFTVLSNLSAAKPTESADNNERDGMEQD